MIDTKDPATNPVGALLNAWQMPMMLYCDWLKMAMSSFEHRFEPTHPASCHEDEGQLVVPDPIEDEGEHALFA